MLTNEQEKAVQAEILKYYEFVGYPPADDLEAWKSQSATWQLAWAAQTRRVAVAEAQRNQLMLECDKAAKLLLEVQKPPLGISVAVARDPEIQDRHDRLKAATNTLIEALAAIRHAAK